MDITFKKEIWIDAYQSLDGLIERLQKIKEEHQEFTKVDIDISSTIDNGVTFHLRLTRPETAQEKKSRLAASKKRQQQQVEYEREQYERLKKKFEKMS